jgi:hypothetical protein
MPMIYCLTPINREHESWERSNIAAQVVTLLAHDCDNARRRVARAAAPCIEIMVPEDPTVRYSKLVLQKSPWELDDVTECQLDPDQTKAVPGDDIELEDGSRLTADWG